MKIKGLSSSEVEERIRNGQVNGDGNVPTKSVKEIIRTNTFTFFNLLNVCLAIMVFAVGSPKNALFMGVILCNTMIGIIQEIRAKRIIDKLSLISAPKVKVIRDGNETVINSANIVKGDIMRFTSGMQVCADAKVIYGECEVNESFVTGESDPQPKAEGCELLSGSFIICGEAYAEAVGIGADSFTNKITSGVKYLKKPNSKMLGSLNKILKLITICIVPIALILFYKSVFVTGEQFSEAVLSVVAAVVGMIPQGLILLVGMVLAVAGIRLSRHNALVQDLYCVEMLARTDVLCLDKTGTITEGCMRVEDILPLSDALDCGTIISALSELMNVLPDDNPTASAIRRVCSKNESEWECVSAFSFSSAKKWSGAEFKEQGSFILGAAEFILGELGEDLKEKLECIGNAGKRAVLLAFSKEAFSAEKQLPSHIVPAALITISDPVRKEAAETLGFFSEQGVEIKVISGDNPVTVKSAAQEAGVRGAENYIDMTFVTDSELAEAALKYTVFGRVSPEQKLKLIKSLKSSGRTVAMTGDGVNDAPALKEADCSIAMQSGSDAAKNVSGLVLMDSSFASIPRAFAEGRRSINNIERSAVLFFTKTVYAFILALIFLFVTKPYPFLPMQMTLINGMFIGIPSFLLALEPNTMRVKGIFSENVFKKAVPFGLSAVLNISALTAAGHILELSFQETRALATFILGFTSFVTLCFICKPFNLKRVLMVFVLVVLFVFAFILFGDFFSIPVFSADMIIAGVFILCLTPIIMLAFLKFAETIPPRFKSGKKER